MVVRTIGRTLLFLLLIAAGSAWSDEDDGDLRFLEGLRQRRLFRLAETFCREQLADDRLEAERQADLTTELMRCFGAQAANATPEQCEAYWQQARQTAADFLQRTPDHPRRLLVQVQDALTILARGELHRQESEVLADPGPAIESARLALREATRSLQQLDQQLTSEIPLRHRQTPAEAELTADELISLQHHVQFQLARAYRNRALCYPSDSQDRVAALTGAVEQLNKPLTQITDADPLSWQIRLDLGTCLRLLGQAGEAEQMLLQVEQSDAAVALRLRARAERARIRLDQLHPEDALIVLREGRELEGRTDAELDYAYLETFLALWQVAVDKDDSAAAEDWRKRAVNVVRLVEATYGPYWGRRGDLLLVRSIGRSNAAGDIEILSRAADDLYRQGQLDEAVKAYEQAGAAAASTGKAELAFTQRYKAALVEHTHKQYRAASQRLRRLAVDFSSNPTAPNVHLLAAWNAAQLARSEPDALDLYAELLQEHLTLWPSPATSDTARLWLGRLRQSQRQWRAAAEAFQSISSQHAEYAASLRSAADCWIQALEGAKNESEERAELARVAANAFRGHTPLADADIRRPWTENDRFAAKQAARLLITYTQDGYAAAESILQTALDAQPPPDADWQMDAESLLIVALAGQPARRVQAEQRLLKVGIQSPQQLLQILQGLSRITQAADPQVRQQLASLQVTVAEQLWERREEIGADSLTMLRRVRAESLRLAGHREQAVAAYADLAVDFPDDGAIQQAYAQLLLDGDDRDSWQQALDTWRKVAARSQARTDRWFQARYAIASALIKLGQDEEAANRIRYLQALPPGLDGTTWKEPFEALLRQCNP